MLINFIIGFLIPAIFGMYLLLKDKLLFLISYPISSLLAVLFNIIGFYFGFFKVTPIQRIESMSDLPMDLGLYAFLGGYFIYFYKKNKAKRILYIIIFSIITTFLEWIGVYVGKIIYYKDWNIFYSFLSYVLTYFILLLYYNYINKCMKQETAH